MGSYAWVRGATLAGWGSRLDGWTAGVQAQWSIFDGRATAGRVVQARSQLEQTKLSLAEATLAVEVQVRQAYSSLVEAWELVQASSKTVEQAQEALRLANVRHTTRCLDESGGTDGGAPEPASGLLRLQRCAGRHAPSHRPGRRICELLKASRPDARSGAGRDGPARAADPPV